MFTLDAADGRSIFLGLEENDEMSCSITKKTLLVVGAVVL